MPPIGEKLKFVPDADAEAELKTKEIRVLSLESYVLQRMTWLTDEVRNPAVMQGNFGVCSKSVEYHADALADNQTVQAWCQQRGPESKIELLTAIWTRQPASTTRILPEVRVTADPHDGSIDYQFAEDPGHTWSLDDKLIALGNIVDTIKLIEG